MHALALVDHAAGRRPVVGAVAPPVLHQQEPRRGPRSPLRPTSQSRIVPVCPRSSIADRRRPGRASAGGGAGGRARGAGGRRRVRRGRSGRCPGTTTWAGARPTPPAGTWSAGDAVAGDHRGVARVGGVGVGRRGRAGHRGCRRGCGSAPRRCRCAAVEEVPADGVLERDDTTRRHPRTAPPGRRRPAPARGPAAARTAPAPRPCGSAMRSRRRCSTSGAARASARASTSRSAWRNATGVPGSAARSV